jgi:hypothetical protein
MVTNNFDEPPTSMTRGTPYILYKKDNAIWIGYSDQFNGDMYPGGAYESMVDTLKEVTTYEDFGLCIHKFNKDNHNYSNLGIYHKPLKEYLNSDNETIDFNDDYYKHWFSDYLFFLNLTGSDYRFIMIKELPTVISNDMIITVNFGESEAVYVTKAK